jgi:hypothetical protein
VTLMLVLSARGSDVGVPALGHPPASQLNRALIERGLQLQQQERLFEVEHTSHRQ